MRVYVVTNHTAVLEVFTTEQDAKRYKVGHEEKWLGERLHIQPRELRTGVLKDA